MQGEIAADEEDMRRSGLHFGHEKKKINVPDVYKRQALDHVKVYRINYTTGKLKLVDIIPVSYTHLDVYKRQFHT